MKTKTISKKLLWALGFVIVITILFAIMATNSSAANYRINSYNDVVKYLREDNYIANHVDGDKYIVQTQIVLSDDDLEDKAIVIPKSLSFSNTFVGIIKFNGNITLYIEDFDDFWGNGKIKYFYGESENTTLTLGGWDSVNKKPVDTSFDVNKKNVLYDGYYELYSSGVPRVILSNGCKIVDLNGNALYGGEIVKLYYKYIPDEYAVWDSCYTSYTYGDPIYINDTFPYFLIYCVLESGHMVEFSSYSSYFNYNSNADIECYASSTTADWVGTLPLVISVSINGEVAASLSIPLYVEYMGKSGTGGYIVSFMGSGSSRGVPISIDLYNHETGKLFCADYITVVVDGRIFTYGEAILPNLEFDVWAYNPITDTKINTGLTVEAGGCIEDFFVAPFDIYTQLNPSSATAEWIGSSVVPGYKKVYGWNGDLHYDTSGVVRRWLTEKGITNLRPFTPADEGYSPFRAKYYVTDVTSMEISGLESIDANYLRGSDFFVSSDTVSLNFRNFIVNGQIQAAQAGIAPNGERSCTLVFDFSNTPFYFDSGAGISGMGNGWSIDENYNNRLYKTLVAAPKIIISTGRNMTLSSGLSTSYFFRISDDGVFIKYIDVRVRMLDGEETELVYRWDCLESDGFWVGDANSSNDWVFEGDVVLDLQNGVENGFELIFNKFRPQNLASSIVIDFYILDNYAVGDEYDGDVISFEFCALDYLADVAAAYSSDSDLINLIANLTSYCYAGQIYSGLGTAFDLDEALSSFGMSLSAINELKSSFDNVDLIQKVMYLINTKKAANMKDENGEDCTFSFVSVTAMLDTQFRLKIKLDAPASGNFFVTYQIGDSGTEVDLTDRMSYDGRYWIFETDGILPTECHTELFIKVYNHKGIDAGNKAAQVRTTFGSVVLIGWNMDFDEGFIHWRTTGENSAYTYFVKTIMAYVEAATAYAEK